MIIKGLAMQLALLNTKLIKIIISYFIFFEHIVALVKILSTHQHQQPCLAWGFAPRSYLPPLIHLHPSLYLEIE